MHGSHVTQFIVKYQNNGIDKVNWAGDHIEMLFTNRLYIQKLFICLPLYVCVK